MVKLVAHNFLSEMCQRTLPWASRRIVSLPSRSEVCKTSLMETWSWLLGTYTMTPQVAVTVHLLWMLLNRKRSSCLIIDLSLQPSILKAAVPWLSCVASKWGNLLAGLLLKYGTIIPFTSRTVFESFVMSDRHASSDKHRPFLGYISCGFAYFYAPIKVMPHLPPTGHRRGWDHLIPCPVGIFGGLIPGDNTRFCPAIIVLLHAGCMTICVSVHIFNLLLYTIRKRTACNTYDMRMLTSTLTHICL